jgi:hypothetical protein|tara:strand:- start:2973 stop:3272 length:300 start_codon:yes stop_codon:yes gene_type:complete
MIGIVVGGIVSAAAILFLIFKFGKIRRVLAFDIPIDVTSTLGLTFLLAGSFAGMMTAIFGGAIISAVLFTMKKLMGCEKLTAKGWVENKPHWTQHANNT